MTALLLVGCAEGSAVEGEQDTNASPPPMDQNRPDIAAPLGALGKQVSNFAQTGLPFEALQLELEGKAWVYTPGSPEPTAADTAASAAALVYSSQEWGDVVVLEYLDTQTQEELLAEEATFKDDGCSPMSSVDYDGAVHCEFDPFERVSVGNGIISLIAVQGSLISVGWIQPVTPSKRVDASLEGLSVKVEIYGDPATLSRDEATAIASALAASGN